MINSQGLIDLAQAIQRQFHQHLSWQDIRRRLVIYIQRGGDIPSLPEVDIKEMSSKIARIYPKERGGNRSRYKRWELEPYDQTPTRPVKPIKRRYRKIRFKTREHDGADS